MTTVREKEIATTQPNMISPADSPQKPDQQRQVPSLSENPEKRLEQLTEAAKIAFPDNSVMQRLSVAIAVGKAGDGVGISNEFIRHNNLFGIQGEGTAGAFTITTREYADGKENTVKYASNDKAGDSFEQFRKRMELDKYKNVRQAKDLTSAANNLVEAGYVTNPDYAKKLIDVDKQLEQKREQKSAAGPTTPAKTTAISPPAPATPAANATRELPVASLPGAQGKERSRRKIIVLDPGHEDFNGTRYDPGAMKVLNGKTYREADLNMQLALDIQGKLEKAGFEVKLTRQNRDFGENAKNARTKPQYADIRTAHQGDFFVSIHNDLDDSHPDKSGSMVMADLDGSPNSSAYAKAFSRALGGHLPMQNNYRRISILNPKRHQRPDGTERPAMLIETAFMSNESDLMRIVDPEKRALLVEKISRGIIRASTDPQVLAAINKPENGDSVAQTQKSIKENSRPELAGGPDAEKKQIVVAAQTKTSSDRNALRRQASSTAPKLQGSPSGPSAKLKTTPKPAPHKGGRSKPSPTVIQTARNNLRHADDTLLMSP